MLLRLVVELSELRNAEVLLGMAVRLETPTMYLNGFKPVT